MKELLVARDIPDIEGDDLFDRDGAVLEVGHQGAYLPGEKALLEWAIASPDFIEGNLVCGDRYAFEQVTSRGERFKSQSVGRPPELARQQQDNVLENLGKESLTNPDYTDLAERLREQPPERVGVLDVGKFVRKHECEPTASGEEPDRVSYEGQPDAAARFHAFGDYGRHCPEGRRSFLLRQVSQANVRWITDHRVYRERRNREEIAQN